MTEILRPKGGTPLEALDTAWERWSPERRSGALDLSGQLEGELPDDLGSLVVSIVDGNTEPAEDFRLLDIYAGQEGASSTGALLLVNYLKEEDGRGGLPENTRQLLEVIRAQKARSEMPVVIGVLGLEERRIDQLRRLAWDTGVAHARSRRINNPVIGISNDADTRNLSPDYLSQMTSSELADQPAIVWGTDVRFEQVGTDPNLLINRLLGYLSFGRRLLEEEANTPVMFGGSMAMTLETYVGAGDGWTGALTNSTEYGTKEPSQLLLNIRERATGLSGAADDADNSIRSRQEPARRTAGWMEVSPRREVYVFANDPYQMARVISTDAANPYRGYDGAELMELATGIKLTPHIEEYLGKRLDSIWLEMLPPQAREAAKSRLQNARSELELPAANFA